MRESSLFKIFGVFALGIFASAALTALSLEALNGLLDYLKGSLSAEDTGRFQTYFNLSSSVLLFFLFAALIFRFITPRGSNPSIISIILKRNAPGSATGKIIYLTVSSALFFTGLRFIPEVTDWFNRFFIYEYILSEYGIVQRAVDLILIEDSGLFKGFFKILFGSLALILIPAILVSASRFLVEKKQNEAGYLLIFPVWFLFDSILIIAEIVLCAAISAFLFGIAYMAVDLLSNHLIRDALSLPSPTPAMLAYFKTNFISDLLVTGAALRFLILPEGFIKIGLFDFKGGYEFLMGLVAKLYREKV